MKDLSQFDSYKGETPDHHIVCPWCIDHDECKEAIMRMEENRVFLEHMKDNFMYRVKTTTHTICEPCMENEFGKLLLISKN